MTGAIGYLLTRSASNRVRRLASEFRKPGPRIAAAAAIGYFGFLAWLSPNGGGAGQDTQAASVVGALGMLVLVVSAWLLGTGAKLVELTGAERALLLPAPITSGRVMDVKLLRLQVVALGNALMWTALTSGGQSWPVIGQRAVAFWVVITTLQLHRIGAARSRAGAAIHPAIRRILGLIGIGLVALVPVVLSGAIRDSAPGLTAWLDDLAVNPISRVVLWPFVAVLRPLTVSSLEQWLSALGPALGILLLHYAWVRRLGPELERTPDPLTSPQGAPLWPLASTGSAASAFFWKNVTALVRRPTALFVLLAAAVLFMVPLGLQTTGRESASQFLGWMLLMWSLLLLLMGPQFVRNDLRRDQGMLSLLRALPVRGHEIIMGSCSAAALMLASAVMALLLAGAVATAGSNQPPLPAAGRAWWLLGIVLVIGPVALAGILLQNAAVILLPTWSRMTARRGTPTALGSNLANSALTVLLLMVLLVIPATLAFAVWSVSGDDVWVPVACGLVIALVLGAECWGIVRWLGDRFERMDTARRAALD